MNSNPKQIEYVCKECRKRKDIVRYPNNISALREKSGLKVGEAADRLQISRSYYSMIENQKLDLTNLSAGLLFRIADLYGVEASELVSNDIAA